MGAVSATHWPIYIGLTKGYYAAEDLKLDLVFIQSSAALVQQLTAGSLDIALSTGLADPIRAIDKGGPIAIVRIEMQAPPYALLAKPAIKHWTDLKGKVISIGGPKDITRIYLERMLVPERRQARRVRHGVRGRHLGALLGAAGRCGRRRDPAAAVQLLRRVGGLQQSRPHHRLCQGAAVRRCRRRPRLGRLAQGDARQGAARFTTRAWPGSPTRRIATKRSRSW